MYSRVYKSRKASLPYEVIPFPVVQLAPLQVTVFTGSNVTLYCALVPSRLPEGRDFSNITFEWFQDGRPVDPKGGGLITLQEAANSSKLLIQISHNSEFSCRARSWFGFSKNETADVQVISKPTDGGWQPFQLMCHNDGEGGWMWEDTVANYSTQVSCHPPTKGNVTRLCLQRNSASEASWLKPDVSRCVDGKLAEILQRIDDIEEGIGSDNEDLINSLIASLYNFTVKRPSGSPRLSFGDFHSSLQAISKLMDIYSANPNANFSDMEVNIIAETASSLLDPSYNEEWEMESGKSPPMLLRSVDDFGRKWAKRLQPGQKAQTLKNYIAVQVSAEYAIQLKSLSYPQMDRGNRTTYPDWLLSSIDNIFVEEEMLLAKRPSDVNAIYYISSSYYRSLASFYHANSGSSVRGLDSRILSLSIDGMPSNHLNPKIRITLQHQNDSDEDVSGNKFTHQCAFWNFSIQPSGNWSTAGCYRNPNASDAYVTTCECDHLTNFAILISPSPDDLSNRDAITLSTISMIGCIISIVSLFLTLVIYATRWKKVKSHQAVVLINLCIALIIADIVFLAGIDRMEPWVGCQVVAVLLHYFFLSAFFLMLAEAIELLLYIVFVFHVRRKCETAALIVCAWVIPLIIVAISMGVSRMEGYGNPDKSCWLPPGRGVFWAFAGPALTIILTNLVIMIIVLCRIARVRRPSEKEGSKERIRATVWNVAVVAPVLGVVWVFGVFSVNRNLVVFQYIFTIANSLQGLFIFIFHGLCNRRRTKARYSVRGQTSKQNQPNSGISSQGQRTSQQLSQHLSSRRVRGRLPTETTDVIMIMSSTSDERRPSEETVDIPEPSQGREAEKVSVSSGISTSCSSSPSSSSHGEDCYSCSTAVTDLTNSADDVESNARNMRSKKTSQAMSDA